MSNFNVKRRIIVPKEDIIPEFVKGFTSVFEKELKANGVKHFRLIDAEWSEEGIIIYYEMESKGPTKAK